MRSNQEGLLFPKPKKMKRKKRHPPSIIPGAKNECLLCELLHNDRSAKYTEEHHVFFGSGKREISEAYGLKCRLCKEHHTEGREAVHRNKETRRLLCALFQREFEKAHSHEEFMELIGKNYI